MHEMSIATSVLEAVEAEAERHGGGRVLKIGLRIGEWSGVDPEALRFCFDALVAGRETTAPALEIDFRPRQNRCPSCGTVFALKDFEIQCPECRAEVTEPVSGNELEVAYIELEEP
jgi:hydrogenase nickel incorporation protein HypA/HybF